MKRILITGVNGYIGSAFADYLREYPQDYQVDKISLRGDEWKSADFSGYDAVLHAAGLAHIEETKENAHLYYEINRDLTEAVAVKAKAEGVGQFIFLSSMSVYGLDEGVITPDTVPAPKTNYGKSKLQAEEKLQVLRDERFKVAILRPPMVYGKGCKGNYQTLVKLAKTLPVFADYKNQRSMISIENLCAEMKNVIDEGDEGISFPQNGECVCTCRMIQQIAESQGRKLPLTPMLNPCVTVLRRFTAKGRKAFGSLVYQQTERRKKALIVASVASHIDQFCTSDISILQRLGFDVAVACNFVCGNACSDEKVRDFQQRLDDTGVLRFQVDFSRSVSSLGQNVKAYRQLKEILRRDEYGLIHCHTPFGGVLCRMAARGIRKSGAKVIYTAHGFHFFKGASLKNWLLYYPAEKLCSRWTDVLITINQEDYALAKEKMHAGSVFYVPGVGIDIARFSPDTFSDAERIALRASLGVAENEKMLLSVGELTERKNHEAAIRAVARLRDPSYKLFICGCGELEAYLNRLLSELKLTGQVRLLGYRTDIPQLCNSADLYVFPSLQEGLPVALMEAVASKTPVICSDIRGNTDLVGGNSLFDPKNTESISKKIWQCLSSDASVDVKRNYENLQKCDIREVSKRMEAIYSESLEICGF